MESDQRPAASNSTSIFEQRPRGFLESRQSNQHPRESSMATATLMSPAPTGAYHSYHLSMSSYNNSPPSSMARNSVPNPSKTPSIAGILSPVEQRGPFGDKMRDSQSHPHLRQSLPSISDVLSTKGFGLPPVPPPPPSVVSQPSQGAPLSSLMGPPPTLPPFGSTNPPPPPQSRSYADRPPSVESETTSPRSLHTNESQYRPRQPQTHLYSSNLGALPPSQLPLPGRGSFPTSPSHPPVHGYAYENRPYPHQGPTIPEEYATHQGAVRGYDIYQIRDYLESVAASARSIQAFCNQWQARLNDERGSMRMEERLPRPSELTDTINASVYLRNTLEVVRSVAVNNYPSVDTDQRIMDIPQPPPPPTGIKPDDDNLPKPYLTHVPEQVRKRRGRAAMPGRCHSCHRIDTPEWRRGPDGARTLCNACGLHFAKLNKKKQATAAKPSAALKQEPETP